FWATLKCELVYTMSFSTRADASVEIFDCIEGFYNPVRRHSTFRYVSPLDFERRNAIIEEVRA
ncbi:MAG: IS3 family transposase, partial [Egibacteraceae bacterium]